MTAIADQIIDWRSQLAALDPYLKGLGGVVHIRLGQESPGSAFARALRSAMRTGSWPYPWSAVQIDYGDPNTHYISEVVSQIRISTGLQLPQPDTPAPEVSVGIGTDIKARGNVTVKDINVVVGSDRETPASLAANIDQLCTALRDLMTHRRVALIFMDSHQYARRELTGIRRILWESKLESLIEHGLLVLDFSNPQSAADSDIWPPDPCLAIDLQDKYDDSSRASAAEDIAKLARDNGFAQSAEEAKGFAEGILLTSYNIRDMYARLGLCVAARG
jgi:hypothetical protein